MASKFVIALPAETMSATSLGAGERRPMDDLRIEAYGAIDEANSAIGLARVATVTDPDCAKLDATLLRIRSLAGYIIGTLESRFRKRQLLRHVRGSLAQIIWEA